MGETIINVRRIATAGIAAAGLSIAGLGVFAAVPASAATTTQVCKTTGRAVQEMVLAEAVHRVRLLIRLRRAVGGVHPDVDLMQPAVLTVSTGEAQQIRLRVGLRIIAHKIRLRRRPSGVVTSRHRAAT